MDGVWTGCGYRLLNKTSQPGYLVIALSNTQINMTFRLCFLFDRDSFI